MRQNHVMMDLFIWKKLFCLCLSWKDTYLFDFHYGGTRTVGKKTETFIWNHFHFHRVFHKRIKPTVKYTFRYVMKILYYFFPFLLINSSPKLKQWWKKIFIYQKHFFNSFSIHNSLKNNFLCFDQSDGYFNMLIIII